MPVCLINLLAYLIASASIHWVWQTVPNINNPWTKKYLIITACIFLQFIFISCSSAEHQGRIYSKRGPCSQKCGGPNIWIPRNPLSPPPPPPDCLHPTLSRPTGTVVIIDIVLRTRAAMHTTIAAPADWQFQASLSEANCKRVREYWSRPNTYMLNGQSPQKGH